MKIFGKKDESPEKPIRLPSFEEMMERIAAKASDARPFRLLTAEEAGTYLAGYSPIENLRVGDLLRWKPNHQNKRIPEYDETIVVTSVYDSPLPTGVDADENNAADRPDFAFGVIHSDGTFLEFLADSRRFVRVGSIYS